MAKMTIVGAADYNRKDHRIEIPIIVAFGDKQYQTLDWGMGGFRIGDYEGELKEEEIKLGNIEKKLKSEKTKLETVKKSIKSVEKLDRYEKEHEKLLGEIQESEKQKEGIEGLEEKLNNDLVIQIKKQGRV